MTTRRRFTLDLVGAGAAVGAAALGLAAPDAAAGKAGRAPGPGFGGATAAGELAERIRLTGRRLTRGGRPEYTREMVLADVALDRRRRFWEYSGDLSGRYVEALATLPPAMGRVMRATSPAYDGSSTQLMSSSGSRSQSKNSHSAGSPPGSVPARPRPWLYQWMSL